MTSPYIRILVNRWRYVPLKSAGILVKNNGNPEASSLFRRGGCRLGEFPEQFILLLLLNLGDFAQFILRQFPFPLGAVNFR